MQHVLALGICGALCAGCGSGAQSVASEIRPQHATAAEALGEPPPQQCRDVSKGGRPLVVDLKPEQRGDLEVAMSEGIAVVAYGCGQLQLLADCRADGSYGFKGIVLKQQVIRLADADEIRANLPLSGAALASRLKADLRRGTTLDLATALVGNITSTRIRLHRSELRGLCEGATHFVRGANIGAFVLQTGSAADLVTAAEIFGMGAGGGSQSSRVTRVQDGRLEDCRGAHPDADAPPGNCRALVRLRLVPLSSGGPAVQVGPAAAEVAAAVSEEEAGCPEGLVMSRDKCMAPAKAKLHACEPEDVADCTEQCDLGEPFSCARLAQMYRTGKNVAADAQQAAQLYDKACRLEHAASCSQFGILVAEGTGTARDEQRAAELFELACKLGEANGCFNLGTLYYDGVGVPKDPKRAFELFAQSCNAGKAAGCINVGVAYDDGDGVEKNPAQAFSLFKRACEGDEPLGCYNLAYMYSKGSGTAADQQQATRYYERACLQGSQQGCERAAERYLAGTGVGQDAQQGKALLERACKLGSNSACAKLEP
jgi:TPR repeat protein